MRKLFAISYTVLLHVVLVAGFTASGTAATQIAAERAAHVWTA